MSRTWLRKKFVVVGLIFLILGFVSFFLFRLVQLNRTALPKEKRWGVYSLDLNSFKTELVFSSDEEISFLDINHSNTAVIFSQGDDKSEEIFSLEFFDNTIHQLTDNRYRDMYPVWSPNDQEVAFLSFRDDNLDIYVMDSNGDHEKLLYGSEYHDADLDWEEEGIVFTRNSRIWIMNDDGSDARAITSSPNAGVKSDANLPFGDYDPRISPDGSKVLFSRLVDDISVHGNYDFFLIDIDGSNELRLTNSGFSQGIAQWSISGKEIVYSVAAIQDKGVYDIYMMDEDGSNVRNITPSYYPEEFLCRFSAFSKDGETVYFIGEWWEE